jgi:hypothetical protein
LVENLVEIGDWEVLGFGAIIIQKWDFYKRWDGGHTLYWDQVAQDREKSALLLTRLSKLAFYTMQDFLDYPKN